MKVTLNWLKQYVDFNWSPEELAERLTMLGLEVEGVQKIGGEFDGIVVAQVLTKDKHLILFPIVSGFFFLLVVASFVVPLATLVDWNQFQQQVNANKGKPPAWVYATRSRTARWRNTGESTTSMRWAPSSAARWRSRR